MSNFYSWIIRMLLGTVAYLKLKSVQTESRDRISLQRGIKNSVSFHPIKHMTCRSATKSRDSVFWILELSSVSSRWFGRSARKSLLQFKAPDLVVAQRNCAASLTAGLALTSTRLRVLSKCNEIFLYLSEAELLLLAPKPYTVVVQRK